METLKEFHGVPRDLCVCWNSTHFFMLAESCSRIGVDYALSLLTLHHIKRALAHNLADFMSQLNALIVPYRNAKQQKIVKIVTWTSRGKWKLCSRSLRLSVCLPLEMMCVCLMTSKQTARTNNTRFSREVWSKSSPPFKCQLKLSCFMLFSISKSSKANVWQAQLWSTSARIAWIVIW